MYGAASSVREHPAPSGALRPREREQLRLRVHSQGAPSTIRCIETVRPAPGELARWQVREHPAPSGALRRIRAGGASPLGLMSGSTQHHQVRSRLCSIGAGRGPRPKCQGAEAERCCGGASRGRAVSGPPVPFYPVMRTQGSRIRQHCSHTRAGSSRCARCCVA